MKFVDDLQRVLKLVSYIKNKLYGGYSVTNKCRTPGVAEWWFDRTEIETQSIFYKDANTPQKTVANFLVFLFLVPLTYFFNRIQQFHSQKH